MNILHKTSRSIINYANMLKIKTIVIGYNSNWKDKVSMGAKNNRNFYEIPYRRLIDMIIYKANIDNIIVEEITEEYTSKTDSLALEKICKHNKYKGERIRRGLFSSSTGRLINADVNGAINIMRKFTDINNINHDYKKLFENNKIFNPIKVSSSCKLKQEEYNYMTDLAYSVHKTLHISPKQRRKIALPGCNGANDSPLRPKVLGEKKYC